MSKISSKIGRRIHLYNFFYIFFVLKLTNSLCSKSYYVYSPGCCVIMNCVSVRCWYFSMSSWERLTLCTKSNWNAVTGKCVSIIMIAQDRIAFDLHVTTSYCDDEFWNCVRCLKLLFYSIKCPEASVLVQLCILHFCWLCSLFWELQKFDGAKYSK